MSTIVDGVLARHTDDQTLGLVSQELRRQKKWGVQAHPDNTGDGWNPAGLAAHGNQFAALAHLMKECNDAHVADGTLMA